MDRGRWTSTRKRGAVLSSWLISLLRRLFKKKKLTILPAVDPHDDHTWFQPFGDFGAYGGIDL